MQPDQGSISHDAHRRPPLRRRNLCAKSADAHYRLGRLYQDRSRHRDAVSEFRKALATAPDSIKALNALGVSLDALGQYADAATAYTRALDLDPSLDYRAQQPRLLPSAERGPRGRRGGFRQGARAQPREHRRPQ